MYKTCLLPPHKTCLLHRKMMLAMIVTIMREKIRKKWMEPLWVQAASIGRSAEDLCHAGMVGQGGEGKDAKHKILLVGCIDVSNSNEM